MKVTRFRLFVVTGGLLLSPGVREAVAQPSAADGITLVANGGGANASTFSTNGGDATFVVSHTVSSTAPTGSASASADLVARKLQVFATDSGSGGAAALAFLTLAFSLDATLDTGCPANTYASQTPDAACYSGLTFLATINGSWVGGVSSETGSFVDLTVATSDGRGANDRTVLPGLNQPLRVTPMFAPSTEQRLGTVVKFAGVFSSTVQILPMNGTADYSRTIEVSFILPPGDTLTTHFGTFTTPIAANADLSLSKSGYPTAVVGSTIPYVLHVQNIGPADANSVTLTDMLPSGLTLLSCVATLGGACGGTSQNPTVNWPTLAAGASAAVDIVGGIDPSLLGGIVFSNEATVTAGTSDPSTANNSAHAETTIIYNVCSILGPARHERDDDARRTEHDGDDDSVRVRLMLCDVNGQDVSSAAITVRAIRLTDVNTGVEKALKSAGRENPDNNFTFDPRLGTTGGYVLRLSTDGLSGSYSLTFRAGNDPTPHAVQFTVKPENEK
jgi:uncharacterized repeat protein (TIGR01451 family)